MDNLPIIDPHHHLYDLKTGNYPWLQGPMLDRVFGGKVAPLLVHFSHNEKLSARDVAELRKLVDQLEKKGRRHD